VLSGGNATSSWAFRVINSQFYLATTSATTYATSTPAALSINQNGVVNFALQPTNNGTAAQGSGGFVFATSPTITTPTFTTNITDPLVRGGTAVASTLTLQGTSAAGPTTPSLTLEAASTNALVATMTRNGFGIGTATPMWNLTVSSSTVPQLALTDASLTDNIWTMRAINNYLYFATSSPSTFATSTATTLTLDPNGNVGVGTTSPWRTFSINGTVSLVGLTSGTTGNSLCLNASNELTSGATCTVSSARFKNSITPLDTQSGINEVLALQPVSFKYNQGYGDNGLQTQVGFIAEQAIKVDPRLVPIDQTGQPGGFFYQNYTAVLTQAMHELLGAVDVTNALTGTSTLKSAYTGTSTPAITVDAAGNVGIGNIDPHHTLDVNGDIGAQAFVAPTDSWNSSMTSLGFGTTTLATSAPAAVLTATGDGVDLYKLAMYNTGSIETLKDRLTADETRMDSLEARITKLENGSVSTASVTNAFSTSTLTSALNDLGILVAKGITQFNTLVFRQLVASKDADGTSSAGTVTILAGNTVAQINNSLVMPSTKIFLTFNAPVTGSWYVSDKANGSFRVVLTQAQTQDVSFDYFLVQTEGQLATSSPMTTDSGTTTGTDSGVTQGSSGTGTITVLGANPVYLPVNGTYSDPGVAVSNGNAWSVYVNGVLDTTYPLTLDTSEPTTYTLTYKSTDATGNTISATRSVIVNENGTAPLPGDTGGSQSTSTTTTSTTSTDTNPPTITLNGSAAIQLTVGDTFTDPGATALDDVDGDLTAKIVVSGSVDTSTPGMYTLTYSVSDAAGNNAQVSRVVTVVAASSSSSTTATSTDSTATSTTP
jgi:hypothetical protein